VALVGGGLSIVAGLWLGKGAGYVPPLSLILAGIVLSLYLVRLNGDADDAAKPQGLTSRFIWERQA